MLHHGLMAEAAGNVDGLKGLNKMAEYPASPRVGLGLVPDVAKPCGYAENY